MTQFRYFTAGESHGQELIGFLEGIPAGVKINKEFIENELRRRRLGYGRGARQKFEKDEIYLPCGVINGATIGSPVVLRILNSEWPKWQDILNPFGEGSSGNFADILGAEDDGTKPYNKSARGKKLTAPRPGHADLPGMLKYEFDNARYVLERSSARETAARVGIGAIAKQFLQECGIYIVSHIVQIGTTRADINKLPVLEDLDKIDSSPVRCFDENISHLMVEEIEKAKKGANTIGGSFEVVVYGAPVGLGSYIQHNKRLDAALAAGFMSIQAIKSVEIGKGSASASTLGSDMHDEIYLSDKGIYRSHNNAGGIEGGISNGEPIVIRASMKPIATVPRALKTIDTDLAKAATAHHQRSDICAAPAASIVGEAMAALIISEFMLDKFGGDSLNETKRNLNSYLNNLKYNNHKA